MAEQETNKDGLIPGQVVDHDTWAKLSNEHRRKELEQRKNPDPKPEDESYSGEGAPPENPYSEQPESGGQSDGKSDTVSSSPDGSDAESGDGPDATEEKQEEQSKPVERKKPGPKPKGEKQSQ